MKCRLQESFADGEEVVATGVIDISTGGKRPTCIFEFEERETRQCGNAKILAHPISTDEACLWFRATKYGNRAGGTGERAA